MKLCYDLEHILCLTRHDSFVRSTKLHLRPIPYPISNCTGIRRKWCGWWKNNLAEISNVFQLYRRTFLRAKVINSCCQITYSPKFPAHSESWNSYDIGVSSTIQQIILFWSGSRQMTMFHSTTLDKTSNTYIFFPFNILHVTK